MTIETAEYWNGHTVLDQYAWPGGYQMIYVTRDGDVLCAKCAWIAIVGDNPTISTVYWEGADLYCDDCGALLPSAYGDPDELRCGICALPGCHRNCEV